MTSADLLPQLEAAGLTVGAARMTPLTGGVSSDTRTSSRSPAGLPVELPGYEPEFTAVTRGAERADADEIERNPRSAAVRLRAVQRVQGKGRP